MKKKSISKISAEEQQLLSMYPPAKRSILRKKPEELSVGGRLRRERHLRKLSLEDMSQFLGISPSYLGALERGERPITRKIMNLFHDRLKLSYDYILEGRPVTGAMITQYVRESSNYDTRHNIDVLLNVASDSEQEACYHMIHTYLTQLRNKPQKNESVIAE